MSVLSTLLNMYDINNHVQCFQLDLAMHILRNNIGYNS